MYFHRVFPAIALGAVLAACSHHDNDNPPSTSTPPPQFSADITHQGETRNGVRTPLHGGVGDIDGSYNSLRMSTPLTATGYNNVYWGTSYVQTVTFDETGPVAQAMLVYGQSTDPKSPYYADQLPLYSRKEWPSLPFTEAGINADPNRKTTTLTE